MDVLMSRRLGLDLDEAGMDDFLDTDMLSANCSLGGDTYMDSDDWLDSLFEDPVLNDKMITDAAMLSRLQPSDHSYSSINDPSSTDSILGFDDFSKELENDLLSTALDLSQKQVTTSIPTTNVQSQEYVYSATPMTTMTIKQEPIDFTLESFSKNTMTTITTPSQKPHTIILTTPLSTGCQLKTDRMFLPRNSIKVEPVDSLDQSSGHSILDSSISLLPPTPPSSASSDSEGSQSPGRSSPSSPYRHLTSKHATTYMSKDLTPLFTSPIPTSGYLVLSEEEKRTLITEGYPVPAKLPLTKQEEKNLKKVRRKIKNKISAQESRRKKKEYMEALEKRVEVFSQENGDLKRKVDNLETNNRSLLGQLQKLQTLVGKMPRPSVPPATQAGSVLMVVVLCFAMFLGSGSWSPTSLNIGYSSPVHYQPMNELYNKPQAIHPSPVMGPGIERVKVDQYSTPNVKSRVLLSLRDEYDDLIGPEIPGVSPERRECQIEKQEDEPVPGAANVDEPNIIIPHEDKPDNAAEKKQMTSLMIQPPSDHVLVDARIPHVNDSADAKQLQELMHPDIATTADISATRETVS